MKKQPLENLTLYAELMEQLQALESVRSIGFLEGSIVTKNVRGEHYVYFQYYEPGGAKKQLYLGRQSAALEQLIEVYRNERDAYALDMSHIQRLCAQLRAGQAQVTDHASARVIRQMAESGVFRLGGVLVGTHAYIVLGNVLGAVWEHAATRTRDIDIAGLPKLSESELAIVLPQTDADIPSALESLKMGFFPVPQLDHHHPSTSFMVRGNVLRVDILTPQKGKQSAPIYIPRFKTAAKPLQFLDYLLEENIQAVVIDGGGILVNVPSPSRYAIHKLIVAQERSVDKHAKKEKDILQAYNILSFLQEERPGDIRLALDSALSRGRGWKKQIETGLAELKTKFGWSLKER